MAICLRKEGGFGERYERRVFVVQLLASLDPTYHPISHHQTAFTRSWFTAFTAEHRFSEMACQGYPHHEFDNALPFAVLSARRQLNFSPLMSFRSLWPLFVWSSSTSASSKLHLYWREFLPCVISCVGCLGLQLEVSLEEDNFLRKVTVFFLGMIREKTWCLDGAICW